MFPGSVSEGSVWELVPLNTFRSNSGPRFERGFSVCMRTWAINLLVPMGVFKRHLPDIEQWSRAMALTLSRGGLVLA
jgi:hypothetical protein